LREADWLVNFKRVYRLWCQEGLKGPKKQRQRLYDGTSANSCDKKRPEHYNHVWSYDFLSERLENGRRVRLLAVIDEYTRECLALDVARSFRGDDVVELLRQWLARPLLLARVPFSTCRPVQSDSARPTDTPVAARVLATVTPLE